MSTENGHQEGEQGITLMIDNYDSFTYNIVQYLAQLGANGYPPLSHTHPSAASEPSTQYTHQLNASVYTAPMFHVLLLLSTCHQCECIATTRSLSNKPSPSTQPTSSSHPAQAALARPACPKT